MLSILTCCQTAKINSTARTQSTPAPQHLNSLCASLMALAPNQLNTSAEEFTPTQTIHQQRTIMNRPRFNRLCRFHCHKAGNLCHFGDACWFGHARELHRPTYAEQTAALLQTVHTILLLAASCLQHNSGSAAQQTEHCANDADGGLSHKEPLQTKTGPAPSHAVVREDDDAIESKPKNEQIERKEASKDDERKTSLEFENQIETKVDIQDKHKDFTDAKVDTASAAKTLDAPKEEKLWTSLLCNNPQALFTKYPKLRKKYFKLQCIGKMDAIIIKLKKQELN